MIQVVYVQYQVVKVKLFEGDDQTEEALCFIDALKSHLFAPGGVVLMVIADKWNKTRVGDRAERGWRYWMDGQKTRQVDDRLNEWIDNEGEQPCLHCDIWCHGKCRGATTCIQAGKPGHGHCHSRLIDEGILTRRG